MNGRTVVGSVAGAAMYWVAVLSGIDASWGHFIYMALATFFAGFFAASLYGRFFK